MQVPHAELMRETCEDARATVRASRAIVRASGGHALDLTMEEEGAEIWS